MSFAEAVAASNRIFISNAPRPPPEVEHVWRWFLEISARRQAGFAANPLTFAELQAWATMTHTLIEPWEARLIMRVDDAVLAATRKKPDNRKVTVVSDAASVAAMLRTMPNKPRKRQHG